MFISAIWLTVVNLLLRFAGTGFQVFLSSRIGPAGIGLLQLVLSVSMLSTVAGMAGIRTTTMYLTADQIGRHKPQNIHPILSGCILYSILCSGAIAILLLSAAPYLAQHWIGNADTEASIRLFAAFLPINCLTGVMVGYFTGAQRIRTLAAVEVAEQLCSMLCTVLLLNGWAGTDPAKCAFCVVLGSGLAACITLLSLAILRILEHPPKGPKIPVAKVILDTSLPLAIADDLRTGITTVENLIVPLRLALFEGSIAPLAAFGTVCGMVFPILMFPVAILYGMTELLVPELARCRAANSQIRIDYLITRGLRIALLYGTLCAGILYLSSDSLCMQLYDSKEAGRYLRLFAPLAVMLYCDTVTDSMIKGLGQQKASVRYNILTNSMDVLFLYIWLPRYGMNGYFWSFLLTHAVNFVLSIRRLLRISRVQIDWKTPAITLVVSLLSVWLAGFASSALLRAIAYILLLPTGLCITNVLNHEDLIWLKGLIRKEKVTNT